MAETLSQYSGSEDARLARIRKDVDFETRAETVAQGENAGENRGHALAAKPRVDAERRGAERQSASPASRRSLMNFIRIPRLC